MKPGHRAYEENYYTKHCDQPYISKQHADERKAEVKCFLNRKRPKNVPLIEVPAEMDQQSVESKRQNGDHGGANRVIFRN